MKRPITYLKNLFSSGKTPTADNYSDVFDSYVHIDNQQAVDQQLVNQTLATYDSNLRSRNVNGVVDTLGDLFGIFLGWNDNKTLNQALTDLRNAFIWGNITQKPTKIDVVWTEQIIDIDPAKLGYLGGTGSPTWLVQTMLNQVGSESIVILDIQLARRITGTTDGTANGQVLYADTILKLKIGRRPNIVP